MKLKLPIFSILMIFVSCNTESRAPLGCGGGIEFTCPIGMYCQMMEDCGGIDSKGYCLPIPKSCSDEESIICGCDNREYKNKCVANTQSISLKNTGPCISSPEIEIQ